MGEIVCRHLNISLSTPHDLKRIHKSNAGPEIVRKLRTCALENESRANIRVLGGILIAIRTVAKDAILGREIYNQNLYDFVIRCVDIHPEDSDFRDLVIQTLAEFASDDHTFRTEHDFAIKGIPKVAGLISEYANDELTLNTLLMALHSFMTKLGSYKSINEQPLPRQSLQSLELPRLAKTLVNLLDLPNTSLPLQWDNLELISEALTWIAYYQSKAILDLPSKKGILLFIAFINSPSITIRCRGLLGLLNTYGVDSMPNFRFCDPQRIFRSRGLSPPEAIFALGVVAATHFKEQLADDLISEHYY
ncbi:hypothetical protein SISNIDRAFT_483902 [Sistotremastrum niveocremeum HHB9708]|uniref:Uncharacterized protein n=1 Tax=Sistotremastrum niveocremeum HHB9708 TaxID=1314777 RepID=A0A164X6K5_9AGAM|nr:hypothetical protein SISNIDRAFT_483902 [Sistotremastrum niveocremeum HHB9708]